MNTDEIPDITAAIGDRYNIHDGVQPEIPMYSFSRPATILWQAVYEAMRENGVPHDAAVEWLQSKNPRWQLDGSLGDALRDLGRALGAREAKEL